VHNVILHIIGRADWAQAQAMGAHHAASLADVGFTHCSDPGTVHLPAQTVYAGRTDLLLLEIDPALVDAPVRWEAAVPPAPVPLFFPHVYGPIPVDAVIGVHDFPPADDGTFHLPASLAELGTT
jgi:uncharacterized protein (DUF952 family)